VCHRLRAEEELSHIKGYLLDMESKHLSSIEGEANKNSRMKKALDLALKDAVRWESEVTLNETS